MNFFILVKKPTLLDEDPLSLAKVKARVTAWKTTTEINSIGNVRYAEYPWGILAYSSSCRAVKDQSGGLTVIAGQQATEALADNLHNTAQDQSVQVDGFFTYAVCKKKYATIGTDQLSLNPLYVDDLYAPRVFSNYSTLAGCLSDKFSPNLSAMLDFATKDSLLTNDSFVDGIYRATRGTVYRIDESGTPSHTVVDNLARIKEVPTLDQAVESIDDFLLNSQLDDPVVLGLTGGLDSRVALAFLKRNKVPFSAATHNHPCRDSEIAEILSNQFEFKFEPINRGTVPLPEFFLKFVQHSLVGEGMVMPVSWSFGKNIYELVLDKKAIHLGGLGGEVTRGYWDQAEAQFQSFQDAMSARFFNPRYRCFYRSKEELQLAKERWTAPPEMEAIDPFACLHVAYLDRRLRGVIAARSNALQCPFFWLLANSTLFQYAVNQSRAVRQSPQTLIDLIKKAYPSLNNVEYAAGSAGDYSKSFARSIKSRLGGTGLAQRLSGRRNPTEQGWIREILLSDHGRGFMERLVSNDGMTRLSSRSRSFDPAAQGFLSGLTFSMLLEKLKDNVSKSDCGQACESDIAEKVMLDLASGINVKTA